MKIRYVHTNIVAKDWRGLARFYERVFHCTPVPPLRSLSGRWLEEGTGVTGAALEGVHLRLPGCGPDGPTLEIYSFRQPEPNLPPAANRLGYGHLAFAVEDVDGMLARVIQEGGHELGHVVHHEIPGKGRLTFVYATDPEGNILELQRWG